MRNKMIFSLLACCMALSLSAPTFAELDTSNQEIDENSGQGTSEVTVAIGDSSGSSSGNGNFTVTVPTVLPFAVRNNGTVLTATDGKIKNYSLGPVEIRGVTGSGVNGWAIVEEGTDFARVRVNTKAFTMSVNDDSFPAAASGEESDLPLTGASWPAIDGGGNLPVQYEGTFAIQDSNISGQIANVVFSVGWHRDPSTVVTGLRMGNSPTKSEYTAGENFNPSGMVIRIARENNTYTEVTDYTVVNGTNLAEGQTSVTLRYEDENGGIWTVDVPITVSSGIVEWSAAEASALLTYEDNATGVTLTGLTDTGKSANITELPDRIDGKTVNEIGASAFQRADNLRISTLPAGLETIGHHAFLGCSNLCASELPSGLETIEMYAFYNSGVTFSEIPYGVTTIGNSAFGNTAVTISTIPSTVTSLGGAFYYCENITTFTFPDGLTEIGESCFQYCSNLESVVLPNTLTVIACAKNAELFRTADTSLSPLDLNRFLISQQDSSAGNGLFLAVKDDFSKHFSLLVSLDAVTVFQPSRSCERVRFQLYDFLPEPFIFFGGNCMIVHFPFSPLDHAVVLPSPFLLHDTNAVWCFPEKSSAQNRTPAKRLITAWQQPTPDWRPGMPRSDTQRQSSSEQADG